MENMSSSTKEFSINKTSSYVLLLQLDCNSYSFSIIDSIRKTYVSIKHENFDNSIKNKYFTDKAKYMFKNDVLLTKNYKTVNFNFVTHKSTLIPESLFDRNKLKSYFEFNHILNDYEELHFNYLKNIKAYNIFAVPSEITTLLVNRFPEIRFYNQTSSIIENAVAEAKNLKFKLPFVQVNFNEGFFDIAVVVSEKLALYNSFTYKNENDFIYFIFNTLTQLDLKAANTYIYLSGNIEENSDFFRNSKKYMPNLRLSSLNRNTKYSFKDIPEHLLYNVLNLHECE